ncbi:HvfC/BufC N-terminal domain-containing protein [Paraliomyxa miuraensis]|uniref:HvfC/BufC N-terminal domain-containing protein n=1 Tax=Paraliomyxa miuraensis TaxID=376150 RepID=UPI0022514F70|nr:DNA-binding domain-containing protein [Paraliomyxa miuraensis]MCX4244514.1 DNA-binding domain-containing protein [Paraliomyxa miuraensis]
MSQRLRDEQALFWRAISWPTGVDDFLARTDDATREAFGRMVTGDARLPGPRRMTIYAESYFYRLADVLREQYRVLAWIIGPVRFHDLATDFVWQRPSHSPDVRRFGEALPDFLAGHPLEARHPGLGELARVERAIVTAIDRPDSARGPVERSALQAVEAERWPGLRLRLADHVEVLTTRRSYPLAFAAWRDDAPSPDPIPPVPEDGPFHVLVWRTRLEVFHRALVPAQAAALRALAAGRTFEAMCDAAVELDPSLDPATLVRWLGTWIDDGLFHALEA